MSQICAKAVVNGMVQGVGFRFHTAHEGLRLGLSGYAKNLPDGSVEVLVCGNEVQVGKLLEWLNRGPATSRVDGIASETVEWRHVDGFEIM